MKHTPAAEGFAALIYAEDTLMSVVVPEEPFPTAQAVCDFVDSEGGLAEEFTMKTAALVTADTITDAVTEAVHSTEQGPRYAERLAAALVTLAGLEDECD